MFQQLETVLATTQRFVPISPVKWEDTDQFLSELFFGGGGVIVIAYTVYSSELEYLLNWTLFQNKDSIVNQRWRYQKSQVICERFTVYCLFFICSFFFLWSPQRIETSILQNQQLMLNLDSPQVMKEPI